MSIKCWVDDIFDVLIKIEYVTKITLAYIISLKCGF